NINQHHFLLVLRVDTGGKPPDLPLFPDVMTSSPERWVARFRLRFRHKSGLRQPASRYLPVNLSSLLTSHGGTVDRQKRYYAVCLFAPGMTSRCCSPRVHCLLLVSPDS